MPGYVAHLDADCFYVSAERVRHPDLVGKAVGVLGNNGACVIAKSYEMKACGVKTGTPIWDVAKLCPEGVYVNFIAGVGKLLRFTPFTTQGRERTCTSCPCSGGEVVVIGSVPAVFRPADALNLTQITTFQ